MPRARSLSNLNNRKFPSLEEVCVSNPLTPALGTHPSVPAVYLAATYACEHPLQADRILGGDEDGFAYQRDKHPNSLRLAEKFRLLHHADHALVTNSGMAALSTILLSQLHAGDHVLLSRYLYGRSSVLVQQQLTRFGIQATEFDPTDLSDLVSLIQPGKTKLLLVETIANPLLQVVDLPQLIGLAHEHQIQVAVDNTFATPFLCRPLELGADWVWESVSKMLNGHSDLMMGMVCGRSETWGQTTQTVSTWGFASAPWDCYLAERGLMTFGVRMERACQNAARAANLLEQHSAVQRVYYPGLANHASHSAIAKIAHSQTTSFNGTQMAGNVVTFDLDETISVEQFMAGSGIHYFPSLGECATTLSHPASSSHRHLNPTQRTSLGIQPGTIRLSFGIEPTDAILERLQAGLKTG